MGREEREKRVSAARRRAEQHATGYETTVLRIPEGVGFFDGSVGTHVVDIIPYIVQKGKETRGGNPMAEKGELYFERTYFAYKRIGPDEKSYVCPSKTFGEPDFIAEFRQKESKNPNADAAYLKQLNPKERQIFLVFDRKNPDKGIQIFDISYHLFGKLLDSRVQNSSEDDGWDLFYFPDDDGLSLRLTIEEVSNAGYKYTEVTAIDFMKRKEPIPEKIVKHNIDLDEMLILTPYEKLKSIFLGVSHEETKDKTSEGNGQKPTQQQTQSAPPKEEAKKSEPLKASAVGLSVRDNVMYKDKSCMIAKISDDGTSLTLTTNDDNFDIIRAVGCDEVKKLNGASGATNGTTADQKTAPAETKQQEAPKETASAAPVASGKEDAWDKDWD